MNKHTDSFYAHSIPNMPEFPQLQGNIECDVCVVGAGFSGLSSALHLAEKGCKVVVLESAKVGFGHELNPIGTVLAYDDEGKDKGNNDKWAFFDF